MNQTTHIESKHNRLWFWHGNVIRFVKCDGGRWRFMAWRGPRGVNPRALPE